MLLDPHQLAADLLQGAYHAGGMMTFSFEIGHWQDEMVRETIDHILANRDTFKLRLKGIRTDTVGFAKFGIPMDRVNSGLYRGIPVVIAAVPFDTMELVFGPER